MCDVNIRHLHTFVDGITVEYHHTYEINVYYHCQKDY